MKYVKNITNKPEPGKTYIAVKGWWFEIPANDKYVGAVFPLVIVWTEEKIKKKQPAGWWVDDLESEIRLILEKGVNLTPNFEPVIDAWFRGVKLNAERIIKDVLDANIRIKTALYEGPGPNFGWSHKKSQTVRVIRFVKYEPRNKKFPNPISEWVWEENGEIQSGRFNPNRPKMIGWRTTNVSLL